MHVTISHRQTAKMEIFPWGVIWWLCNRQIDPEAEQTLGIVSIKPGRSNPLHYHPIELR